MNQRLFVDDPFSFFEPLPYGALEFQSHMIVGGLWFIAGVLAFLLRKGGIGHIWAGRVSLISVVLVAVSAVAMLLVVFIPPLMLAAVTAVYAAATGWLALKKPSARVRAFEIGLFIAELAVLGMFLSIALPNALAGVVPPFIIFVLVAIPVALLAGDVNWLMRPRDRAKLRIRRHLARMVWCFVVTLRAPLVEFETGGYYHLPDPVLVIGPFVLGLMLLAYFQWRYRRGVAGKTRKPPVVTGQEMPSA